MPWVWKPRNDQPADADTWPLKNEIAPVLRHGVSWQGLRGFLLYIFAYFYRFTFQLRANCKENQCCTKQAADRECQGEEREGHNLPPY